MNTTTKQTKPPFYPTDRKQPRDGQLKQTTLTKKVSVNDLENEKWNEWLAGLIDGDGSLLLSKTGYCSCEITMDLRDEHTLLQIKAKLGGSVKLRSGVKAVRYRLHHLSGIIDLVNRVNGKLRVTNRIVQLKALCENLNIPYVAPVKLNLDNSWFIGYFDAEGCISAKFDTPSITLSASNKDKENLEDFRLLNGQVYYDKACYGSYFWSIQSESDVLNFLAYSIKSPSRSSKLKRLKLIKSFYELRSLSAHTADPSSSTHKAWLVLKEKWTKFEE